MFTEDDVPFSEEVKASDYREHAQVDAMLEAAHANSVRDYLILKVLWQTGTRVDELLHIRPQDIEYHNQRITIVKVPTTRFSRPTSTNIVHVLFFEQLLGILNKTNGLYYFTNPRRWFHYILLAMVAVPYAGARLVYRINRSRVASFLRRTCCAPYRRSAWHH